MSERFAQVWDDEMGQHVARWLESGTEGVHDAKDRDPSKDYNVSPADRIGVLVHREGRVVLEWAQWGFRSRQGVIRISLDEVLGSWRWRRHMDQRVAVPMTGFYEWRASDGQPYFYHRRDGAPLMAAAVATGMRRRTPRVASAVVLLVGPPAPEMVEVPERLPLVLEPDDVAPWLGPAVHPEDAARLVAPPRPDSLDHYPVTREIGRIKARGSSLQDPIGPGPRQP